MRTGICGAVEVIILIEINLRMPADVRINAVVTVCIVILKDVINLSIQNDFRWSHAFSFNANGAYPTIGRWTVAGRSPVASNRGNVFPVTGKCVNFLFE